MGKLSPYKVTDRYAVTLNPHICIYILNAHSFILFESSPASDGDCEDVREEDD